MNSQGEPIQTDENVENMKTTNPKPGIQNKESKRRNPKQRIQVEESEIKVSKTPPS